MGEPLFLRRMMRKIKRRTPEVANLGGLFQTYQSHSTREEGGLRRRNTRKNYCRIQEEGRGREKLKLLEAEEEERTRRLPKKEERRKQQEMQRKLEEEKVDA